MTQSVLLSEKKVRDALKEIELLKEKVGGQNIKYGNVPTSFPSFETAGKSELDEIEGTTTVVDSGKIMKNGSSPLISHSPTTTAAGPPRPRPLSRPPPRPVGSSAPINAVRSPPPPPVSVLVSQAHHHQQAENRNAPLSPPDLLY